MNRKCLHIAIVIILGLVGVTEPTNGVVVEGGAPVEVSPSNLNHSVGVPSLPSVSSLPKDVGKVVEGAVPVMVSPSNINPQMPIQSNLKIVEQAVEKSIPIEVSSQHISSPVSAPVFPKDIGKVVEGSAIIFTNPSNPNHQIITQTGSKVVIDWHSFNIGPDGIKQFIQPSASAIALNRVTGGSPSVILGTLKANGQVWLINPSGILFGQSAIVDVAGLLATTANITNQDFRRGHYQFLQPPGRPTSVINRGQISIKESGIAALVAPGVENSGIIEANLGTVALASGTEYVVDFYGDKLIHFAVDQAAFSKRPTSPEGHELKHAVSNSGKLIANGGKVLLTTSDAKQVVENLINMDGIIQANTVVQKEGQIILQGENKVSVEKPGQVILQGSHQDGVVKVSGKIEAQGKKGGQVTITGNKVGLFEGTEINVSGEEGGGTALIGGGFQGKGPLPWAEATFMGKGAKIRADAIKEGNGGLAVLWSEKWTRCFGDISAKGGSEGGNGGVIETSGHRLDIGRIKISAAAPKGLAGKYLMDPWNVSITDSASPGAAGAFQNQGGTQVWVPDNTGSTVALIDLIGFLDAGTNVEIQTIGVPDGGEPGDITLVDPLPMATATVVTLTLRAVRDINLNNNVTGAGLNLVLIAPGTVSGVGKLTVAALQLNVGTAFVIGDPPHGGSLSFVNGVTTGSNITLLNTFGPGTHFFNGNDLFQYLSSPPAPVVPPVTTVNSTLDPSNFGVPPPQPPVADPNSNVIDNQVSTQSSTSSSSSQSTASTQGTEASSSTPSTTETTTPTTTSTTEPAAAPETTTPEPAPSVEPEGAAPSNSTGDVPVGSDVIGGAPEGQEPIQTVEGAEGREGVAENAWEPEAVEQTTEIAATCPVNVEESKGNIPPECPEKPSGPVSSETLAEKEVAPDSMIAKEIQQQPVGPEGVHGVDVPVGAEGIGGSILTQETVDTIEGAEGNEVVLEKDTWNPEEDVDRSYEYLENLGPERPKKAKSVSFWIRRLFARLRIHL